KREPLPRPFEAEHAKPWCHLLSHHALERLLSSVHRVIVPNRSRLAQASFARTGPANERLRLRPSPADAWSVSHRWGLVALILASFSGDIVQRRSPPTRV